MAEYESLRWEVADHVATVTLDRPEKKNAMSWTMFNEIRDAFDRASDDDDVRCLVVTGAGGAFCSGADLSDAANLVDSTFAFKDRMRTIHGIVTSIVNCTVPTIAKVTGIAAGAGCNLAFCCDLVVATRGSAFAELFVRRGLVVDFGGSWALSRLLPLNRAKELALLGETLSAEEAARWGIVNRLCDPGEVDQVVKDLSTRLVALPPRTVTMIKENLNRAGERSVEATLDAESLTQSLAFGSDDTREALMSFLEKREPRFTGR
ncbi:MAG TPA: enoyl-CoA hydratase-related protein [Actinomycetota bacterium]|nr:enoyl-CoA hydratase-related protein [Actinomycetota bacterium]